MWRCNLAIAAQVGLALIVLMAMSYGQQAARERDLAAEWEMHTVQVLDATAQLKVAALYAVRGERGYLLVRDPAFLTTYRQGVAAMEREVARLRHLTADNQEQQERLAYVKGRLDYHAGLMGTNIALVDEGRHSEAIVRIASGDGRLAVDTILAALTQFEAVERRLLLERQARRETKALAAELFGSMLGMAGIVLLAVGVRSTFAQKRAVEREEAIRLELERHARTDELTGLANRRETLAALDRSIALARRNGQPLSVAVLDIDHFKKVNDTHGHPAGDEVLRRIGQIALQIMRAHDVVGRTGGEEFVIILPETDAHEALVACDRLRAALAGTTLMLESGEALSVTLSAGVAQLAPSDQSSCLIARADQALYAAKAAGRDRVLLAA